MNYQPKLPAYAHQRQALAKMNGKANFALLMAMRTGKTKVVLDNWADLVAGNQALDLLVIAPAGVYRAWEPDIRKHVSDELLQRTALHVWETGSYKSARRSEELGEFLSARSPRIFLVNVEAFSYAKTGLHKACETFLAANRGMIVVDESTVIKNHKADRTKYIIKRLRPMARFRRILSGLPTPRSPLDLFCQFEFLDWEILGHPTFTSFRARYAVVKEIKFPGNRWPAPIILGYRDVDRLQEKIEPHSVRVLLKDCYDLPESTYATREVPLTEKQQKVYSQLRDFATAALEEEQHITATLVITQILRLHQVLCGFSKDEQGQLVEFPENKTSQLIELLNEYDGKAIIWCSYDYSIRKVAAALQNEFGENAVARFWGGNLDTREQEEQLFKTNPDCRFMVATPSAGGRGRTWDVADLVVYYSSTDNLEHRDQSEERPKAVGKRTPIEYVDLISSNTIESKIIAALRKKIDLASTITGDNFREWLI